MEENNQFEKLSVACENFESIREGIQNQSWAALNIQIIWSTIVASFLIIAVLMTKLSQSTKESCLKLQLQIIFEPAKPNENAKLLNYWSNV